MCKSVIFVVATLAVICGQSYAADPVNCIAVQTSLDWNNTLLTGSWLELARNPAGQVDACMEYRTALTNNNQTFTFNATHSSTNSSTFQNVNEPTVNVKLTSGSTAGYNVSYSSTEYVYIKLLALVNDNTYVIGCGYTNASEPKSSYGFILGRGALYNQTGLNDANNQAAVNYSDFTPNSFTTILQKGCTRNSATQSLPLVSGILAVALLLIKAY